MSEYDLTALVEVTEVTRSARDNGYAASPDCGHDSAGQWVTVCITLQGYPVPSFTLCADCADDITPDAESEQ